LAIFTVDHRFTLEELPVVLRVSVRKVVIPSLFITIALSNVEQFAASIKFVGAISKAWLPTLK
jgi:hypothetical protein